MLYLDDEKREKMRKQYRADLAIYLQGLAMIGETRTYTQLTEKFGRGPRLWGDPLGGITLKCHELAVPLLPVLIVNKQTGNPSADALLYKDLGLMTDEELEAEQERCFDFDWSDRWEVVQ